MTTQQPAPSGCFLQGRLCGLCLLVHGQVFGQLRTRCDRRGALFESERERRAGEWGDGGAGLHGTALRRSGLRCGAVGRGTVVEVIVQGCYRLLSCNASWEVASAG